MVVYLSALLFSFLLNMVLIVPFINFLYKLKLQRHNQRTRDAFNKLTPIFDKFNRHKNGTPVGGGILLVVTSVFSFILFIAFFVLTNKKIVSSYPAIISEVKIVLFSFVFFFFLGVYDDLKKIFFWKDSHFFGLKLKHKLILEVILASIIAYWLYTDLKIDIINVPFLGMIKIHFLYPFFALFVIVSFANAVNITDGLDGLAGGVLLISLFAFWVISRTILDVPISVFIAVWSGSLLAFLYFNIYPARIMLGDAGSLSFGATFAVIGLILGKAFVLPIIGGVFFIEILSSFFQLSTKKLFKRKLFKVAPFHLWLQERGWQEPKVVMRFWLTSILFGLFGLMLAFMR